MALAAQNLRSRSQPSMASFQWPWAPATTSPCVACPRFLLTRNRLAIFFQQLLRSLTMTETLQFKTELKQLLHLIIHSLYSHKDIFLRELISNASDAIDTVRFRALTDADVAEGDTDWKIKITAD